jgi:hypothetical protein
MRTALIFATVVGMAQIGCAAVVPGPASWVLMLTGFFGLGGLLRGAAWRGRPESCSSQGHGRKPLERRPPGSTFPAPDPGGVGLWAEDRGVRLQVAEGRNRGLLLQQPGPALRRRRRDARPSRPGRPVQKHDVAARVVRRYASARQTSTPAPAASTPIGAEVANKSRRTSRVPTAISNCTASSPRHATTTLFPVRNGCDHRAEKNAA